MVSTWARQARWQKPSNAAVALALVGLDEGTWTNDGLEALGLALAYTRLARDANTLADLEVLRTRGAIGRRNSVVIDSVNLASLGRAREVMAARRAARRSRVGDVDDGCDRDWRVIRGRAATRGGAGGEHDARASTPQKPKQPDGPDAHALSLPQGAREAKRHAHERMLRWPQPGRPRRWSAGTEGETNR